MNKTGVLHTSSAYGIMEMDLTFERRKSKSIQSAYRRLQKSEKELYNEFGQNDYKAFINQLRSFFDIQDMKVINRFRPEYLQKSLDQFESSRSAFYEQNIRIEFNTTNLNKITEFRGLNNKKGEGFDIKIDEKGIPYLNIIYNHNAIKTVLNAFFKGHNYKPGSPIMEYADSFLNELILKDAITVKLEDSAKLDSDVVEVAMGLPNFPWGIDKETYKKLTQNKDETAVKALGLAVRTIKNYIINELGANASDDLKKALIKTWNYQFGNKTINPILFFQGGKTTFKAGVQGALGEFQASLIFTFLQQKMHTNSKYAKIIGNIYEKGTSEQLKTDVQIANKIGLQVKNFTIIEDNLNKTLYRDIETTIHPNKIAKQIKQGAEFLNYIANYFFNKTFREETQPVFDEMVLMLQDYLGEVMNMAINKNIDDNISFYLISGRYLVPASEILKVSDDLNLKDSLIVTSSYYGLDDEAYKFPIIPVKGRDRLAPSYITMWRRHKKDWEATPKNKGLFQKLISQRISIRTRFNLMQQIERYALLA